MVLFSHTDDTLGKSLMIILRFPNSALGVFDYLFCIYRDTYFNHIGNSLFEFKKKLFDNPLMLLVVRGSFYRERPKGY